MHIERGLLDWAWISKWNCEFVSYSGSKLLPKVLEFTVVYNFIETSQNFEINFFKSRAT
jgi:hypothetical protein